MEPTNQMKRILIQQKEESKNKLEDNPLQRMHGGLWWHRDRLFVPKSLREIIPTQFHGLQTTGHWGVMKTLSLIGRKFSWPKMRTDIINFIKGCQLCQQVNVDHWSAPGRLIPLDIPERPWSIIGIDYIVKLPNSNGFDSILVVVDHLHKGAHLIPAKEKWNAIDLADIFIDKIFCYHGLPDKIVSDRGSTFVSQFFTTFLRKLGFKTNASTAFHPQANGQVERINGILEDYLRHFVAHEQTDWSRLTAMAEFAYWNSVSSTTGYSPFFATHGFHPKFNTLTNSSAVPKADEFVKHLEKVAVDLELHLRDAKIAQEKFYNFQTRGERADTSYSAGNWVWLSRRNIKTRRNSEKLDYQRIGPFQVVKMVGKNAAQLSLTHEYRMLHPIFNVSLLMPAVFSRESRTDMMASSDSRMLGWLAVRSILVHNRDQYGNHKYLLWWTGRGYHEDSWVKLGNISTGMDRYLEEWHRIHPEDLDTPDFSVRGIRTAHGLTAADPTREGILS